ncbi:hypothetical protein HYV88_03880 [Candidatus Woesearchaeota archaeon]|nr:hypothetical protein [Candidatus Woesearchaeota archaeon]
MNLAEAFDKTRERFGAEKGFKTLAYAESVLEERLIDEYNKGRGTRPKSGGWETIQMIRAEIIRKLPPFMLATAAPETGHVKASPFVLSYLVDWLIIDEKYPIEQLADQFYLFCLETYKKDGLFPVSVYNGCYGFLAEILGKKIRAPHGKYL